MSTDRGRFLGAVLRPRRRADGTVPRPLYARALRLHHIRPGTLVCLALFEGSVALSLLLAFADLMSWWGALLVPLAVAGMVKLNDAVAGTLPNPHAVRRAARGRTWPRPVTGAKSGRQDRVGLQDGAGLQDRAGLHDSAGLHDKANPSTEEPPVNAEARGDQAAETSRPEGLEDITGVVVLEEYDTDRDPVRNDGAGPRRRETSGTQAPRGPRPRFEPPSRRPGPAEVVDAEDVDIEETEVDEQEIDEADIEDAEFWTDEDGQPQPVFTSTNGVFVTDEEGRGRRR
jgi:hypothetical protein